jgi:TRAP-type transport system small permease protein
VTPEGSDRPAPAGLAARVDRALATVALGLAGLSALCVAAIFVVITTSVAMRYVASRPLAFTEELTGLLLALSVFLVIPHVTAAHRNIRVTLLSDRVPARAGRAVHVLAQAVLAAFLGVFLWESWRFVGLALRFAERTELTRLPIAPFKTAMAGCVAFALLIALWQAFRPPPRGAGLKV